MPITTTPDARPAAAQRGAVRGRGAVGQNSQNGPPRRQTHRQHGLTAVGRAAVTRATRQVAPARGWGPRPDTTSRRVHRRRRRRPDGCGGWSAALDVSPARAAPGRATAPARAFSAPACAPPRCRGRRRRRSPDGSISQSADALFDTTEHCSGPSRIPWSSMWPTNCSTGSKARTVAPTRSAAARGKPCRARSTRLRHKDARPVPRSDGRSVPAPWGGHGGWRCRPRVA